MLVFLDIDGVMVPAKSWKNPEILDDGFAVFSPKAVNALKKIIRETQAGLVLTTSHKSRYSLPDWVEIFAKRGIVISNLTKLSESLSQLSRKQELLNALNGTNVDRNFIIIDDDLSLNDLPQNLKERLILTNGMVGLTDQLADKAITMLKDNMFKASA